MAYLTFLQMQKSDVKQNTCSTVNTIDMDFFENTLHWIKAELFEAWFILVFGVITSLGGFLFWKIGTTPGSQSLLWPLVLSGLIYAGIGTGMLVSNQKRLAVFPPLYEQNKSAFVKAEKARVEAFQYGYLVSKIVASVFFAATLFIFWTTKNSVWQGIGIGLSYFAIAGLVIDYFSQERADFYYHTILKYLH
jgi:hypothetical protein